MRSVFDFYEDPGHGWLKVKKSELEELGIEQEISDFSYMHGNYAYLEEDCDAGIFFNAYKNKYNKEPQTKFHSSNKSSSIRKYCSYIPYT